MRTLYLCFCLLGGSAALALADETALQVAPSYTIKYPDASQILNKTETPVPGESAGLPNRSSSGPLLGTKPLPATAKPLPPAVPVKIQKPNSTNSSQWYLKWTLTGDESAVLAWAQALNRSASVHKSGEGLWEVWAGPLETASLPAALQGQEGTATLVKR